MEISPGTIIIPHGRTPEPHELATAKILTKYGFTVEFLVESQTKGQRSADVIINRLIWEIKSPTGHSCRTIERQFHRASGQSKNLIIDSRRSKMDTQIFRKRIEQEWRKRPEFQRLILIEKDGKIIDYTH